MEKVGSLLGKVFERNASLRGDSGNRSESVNRGEAQPRGEGPKSGAARPVLSSPPSQPQGRAAVAPKNVQPRPEQVFDGIPPEIAAAEARKRYPRTRRPGAKGEFALVKGILAKALAGKGLDRQIERYEFILHWEEIVGETIAQVSKPECISRRTLIVRVSHSAWAQELAFMKPVLLQKLAPFLKQGELVEDVIFRVGPIF